MWVDKTTGLVITFGGGKKIFTKSADSWSSGHHHEDLKGLNYQDGIIYKFTPTTMNNGDTYHIIVLSGSGTPDYSGSGYGVYFYPDGGGVKAHGQTGGGIAGTTAINLPETLSVDEEIQVRWSVSAAGYCNVHVKGGPWADWTLVVDGGSTTDFTPAGPYPSWKIAHGIYSSNSDCVVDEYQLYNSGGPDSENEAPVCDAGADQEVTIDVGADLEGSATDDGIPGALTYLWEKVSGAGDVTFDDDTDPETHAEFSEPDDYVLRLTASDGDLSDADEVTITVGEAPPADSTCCVPVAAKWKAKMGGL